jgi:hypothetical protein
MILPPEAGSLFDTLAPAFTRPTFRRFLVLLGAAILATGRRTVANLLRTAAPLADGHVTTYQRVLSSASWSALRLACGLCRLALAVVPPDRPVPLVGDDTVDGHPGRRVYGKARHRDPIRSSHGYTAWRYGHKWVVLAVLVRFPWATRPWALPVLVDLYRSEEDDRRRRRPHRTPAQVMATLLRVILLRFPDRRFVFVGDAGYGTHELARFAARYGARLTLVSKLHPEANLFEPPPPYRGNGRPPVKGARRPKPRQAVAAADLRSETVAWYGGGEREVGVASGTGHWYKAGAGLVEIAWVFVRDRTGTHRDEYFIQHRPRHGLGGDDRRLHRTLEPGDHVSGAALPPRPGDDAGLVPPHGAPGRPLPIRPVHGRGPAVPGAARGEALGARRVAGEGGRDVLRRVNFRPSLAMAGMGFSTGRRRHGRRRTPRAITRGLVLRPGPGGIASKNLHQSSLVLLR